MGQNLPHNSACRRVYYTHEHLHGAASHACRNLRPVVRSGPFKNLCTLTHAHWHLQLMKDLQKKAERVIEELGLQKMVAALQEKSEEMASQVVASLRAHAHAPMHPRACPALTFFA